MFVLTPVLFQFRGFFFSFCQNFNDFENLLLCGFVFFIINAPGRSGEFHPLPPSEPYVIVSHHTAQALLRLTYFKVNPVTNL
ncbi:MAG: hypothetical protein B6D64_08925 [Bacteroidetes bacterium 4484_276]|nr:MAG: hypothetical protein B6D64_08925 [Bacteroidetes bacterium 4484_276]